MSAPTPNKMPPLYPNSSKKSNKKVATAITLSFAVAVGALYILFLFSAPFNPAEAIANEDKRGLRETETDAVTSYTVAGNEAAMPDDNDPNSFFAATAAAGNTDTKTTTSQVSTEGESDIVPYKHHLASVVSAQSEGDIFPYKDHPAGVALKQGTWLDKMRARVSWRFPADMPFLEAIETCETLNCIRDAHLQPHGDAKYNFPHFFIAGWSKSATTSIYKNLNAHPSTLTPRMKEAELFTDQCQKYHGKEIVCPERRIRDYIFNILRLPRFVESNGQLAAFEATPRIMEIGPSFAEIAHDKMPWVKLIASLREPISRGMSKMVMLVDKNATRKTTCLDRHDIGYCMLLIPNNTSHMWESFGNPKRSYYSTPLKAWFDNFPADQILLVQYEDVIGERMDYEMRRMKEFIGIDPSLPGFGLEVSDVNCRKCRINPDGWPVKKNDYKLLIKRVMPDVLEVVRLIDKYKLGNGTRWLENWQKIWDMNLASCDKDGNCLVKLS